MADDDNASTSAPRPRPTPTIDLKATEVGSRPRDSTSADEPREREASAPGADPAFENDPLGIGSVRSAPAHGVRWRTVAAIALVTALVCLAAGGYLVHLLIARDLIAVARTPVAPAPVAAVPESPPMSETIAAAAGAAIKPLEESLSGLHRRLDELAAAANETRARADEAAKAAAAAASAPRPAASADTPALSPNDIETLVNRLTALEQAVTASTQQPAQPSAPPPDLERRIKFAIAATELRGAVERGQPYAVQLAAAKALAPDAAALAPLDALAGKGAPSDAALAAELSASARAILEAGPLGAESDNLLERLQARALRLVHIRPVGDVAGEEPHHRVARAESRAARGDIQGALEELEKLPEPMRARAQAWIDRAKLRETVVAASRTLAASALGAIGEAGH
ncbi:MAG: hypothetical protein HXY30_08990 [Pseudorhodoplanes sp.]|nr:hypothetical protein [Pseudorhodoplanes sp.]